MHIVKIFSGRRARLAALCGLLTLAVAFDAGAYSHWHRYQVSISGTPSTSDVAGQVYNFTPTATGSQVTFSISGQPSWASFDKTTGRLTGTPGSTNAGTYSNIVISAANAYSSASLAPFSITVTAPQPTDVASISGQPATAVNVGTAYSFTPNASDSVGKPLTFAIQNQPSWASFSTLTGQLSGTPASAGTYSNIVISVSDGTAQASLPAFSIAVNQISGSATITWTPPVANVDGTALTNLAGYRVYYGPDTSNLTQSVQVTNVSASSYTVSNLTSGTWYFGVTAYTTAGTESPLSNLASKAVN